MSRTPVGGTRPSSPPPPPSAPVNGVKVIEDGRTKVSDLTPCARDQGTHEGPSYVFTGGTSQTIGLHSDTLHTETPTVSGDPRPQPASGPDSRMRRRRDEQGAHGDFYAVNLPWNEVGVSKPLKVEAPRVYRLKTTGDSRTIIEDPSGEPGVGPFSSRGKRRDFPWVWGLHTRGVEEVPDETRKTTTTLLRTRVEDTVPCGVWDEPGTRDPTESFLPVQILSRGTRGFRGDWVPSNPNLFEGGLDGPGVLLVPSDRPLTSGGTLLYDFGAPGSRVGEERPTLGEGRETHPSTETDQTDRRTVSLPTGLLPASGPPALRAGQETLLPRRSQGDTLKGVGKGRLEVSAPREGEPDATDSPPL